MKNKLGLCLLFALGWVGQSLALEPGHLRYSVRALGMGNAYLGVGTDSTALYYNPAGLGLAKVWNFQVLNLEATGSDKLLELAGGDLNSALSNLAGHKVYGDVVVEASAGGPGFAVSTFNGGLLDLKVDNPVVPYAQFLAYTQRGTVLGFAGGTDWNWGLSLGQVTREGTSGSAHIMNLMDQAYIDGVTQNLETKTATLANFGLLRPLKLGMFDEAHLAAVWRGGMDFGLAGQLKPQLDLGFAGKGVLGGMDWILAADWVDLNRANNPEGSYLSHLNLGTELGAWSQPNGTPALALRAGFKGPYPCVGWTLNPPYLPLTLVYASWSEEIGTEAGDVQDSRKSLDLSINF